MSLENELKTFIDELTSQISGLGGEYQQKLKEYIDDDDGYDDDSSYEDDDAIINGDNNNVNNVIDNSIIDDDNNGVNNDVNNGVEETNEQEKYLYKLQQLLRKKWFVFQNTEENKEEIDNNNPNEELVIKHVTPNKILNKYKKATKKTQKSLFFSFFHTLYNHTNTIFLLKSALYFKRENVLKLQQKLHETYLDLNIIDMCIKNKFAHVTGNALTKINKQNVANIKLNRQWKHFYFTKLCFFLLFVTFGLGFIVAPFMKTTIGDNNNNTTFYQPTNKIHPPNALHYDLTNRTIHRHFQSPQTAHLHFGTNLPNYRLTQKNSHKNNNIQISKLALTEQQFVQNIKDLTEYLKKFTTDAEVYKNFMKSFQNLFLLSIHSSYKRIYEYFVNLNVKQKQKSAALSNLSKTKFKTRSIETETFNKSNRKRRTWRTKTNEKQKVTKKKDFETKPAEKETKQSNETKNNNNKKENDDNFFTITETDFKEGVKGPNDFLYNGYAWQIQPNPYYNEKMYI